MPSRLPSIALAVLVLIAAIGCEAQPQWVHIQLTDSEYSVGEYSIDGDWIAWVEKERFGRSPDIFLFDGQAVRQLTNDGQKNTQPIVSDGYVVWQARSEYRDASGQIKKTRLLRIFDGLAVRELDASAGVSTFDVSGQRIVWAASDTFGGAEILLYDGERPRRLTNNGRRDDYPAITGQSIAWRGGDNIFLHDGETTRQLSDGKLQCYLPRISGQWVTWTAARNEIDTEVFLHDGQTTRQLTDNEYNDHHPRTDGQNVTWQGFDGSDWEIFLFDGDAVRQITQNDYDDIVPRISESNIVWGGGPRNRPEAHEVFFYDGKTVIQLTDNHLLDGAPLVSGSRIVYGHYDGKNGHIMVAVPADDPWARAKTEIERRLHGDMIDD